MLNKGLKMQCTIICHLISSIMGSRAHQNWLWEGNTGMWYSNENSSSKMLTAEQLFREHSMRGMRFSVIRERKKLHKKFENGYRLLIQLPNMYQGSQGYGNKWVLQTNSLNISLYVRSTADSHKKASFYHQVLSLINVLQLWLCASRAKISIQTLFSPAATGN